MSGWGGGSNWWIVSFFVVEMRLRVEGGDGG